MVLLPGVQVLRFRVRKPQLRDRPDKRPAPLEYIHLRIPLLIEGHSIVHLHPPRDPPVVSLCKVDPVPQSRLIDALSPAGVPDGRVGHSVNAPSLQPRMGLLDLPDFGKLLLRGPPHPLVGILRAAVQL